MAIEIEFKTTIAFDDDTSLEEFVAFDQKLLRLVKKFCETWEWKKDPETS